MQKFGLALGGGGTKGAYHLGVWQALSDMKIEIGCITGTSIGAVNGAMLAQGAVEELLDVWKKISISDVVDTQNFEDITENLFEGKNIVKVISQAYKNNGLETKPLKELLQNYIDEDKLRNSLIDFGLCTYSIDKLEGEELFLENIADGKVIDYIMASASLPGLKQIKIDDKKYIDGGFANNIPADMLVKKGYNNIIYVDVGGVGIVRDLQDLGLNIINIKCSENIIGIMDFNEDNISKMIKLGFYDTLKAFDYIKGDYYNFNISDYHKARIKYSEDIIKGIENGAKIFSIDRFKIYRFDDLKDAVVNGYLRVQNNDKLNDADLQLLLKITQQIRENNLEKISTKMLKGFKKNIYSAANAILYFFNA